MSGILFAGRRTSFYDQLGWQLGAEGDPAPRERSYVSNGRFLHNLDGWNAISATYSAGDADDHYGVAVLATGGGYVSQPFAVDGAKSFTVHLSVKPVGSSLSGGQCQLIITDGSANAVVTQNLSGTADQWNEQSYSFGLAEGTTYTLKVINNSAAGDVKVDDVWLWWLPMSRANIATRLHAKLAALATDNSLSTTPSGDLTEGSYTYAIDAALRQIGAINPVTDMPDIRQLETRQIDDLLGIAEREMFELIERSLASQVDIKVGQREEKLSQAVSNIGKLKKK
jgi:hypothetical protein